MQSSSSVATDAQYLQSAEKSFDEEDFASCLIFLQHVQGLNAIVAGIITSAAYQLWTYAISDLSRRAQFTNLILKAYTRVLDCGNTGFMKPVDYIRLSQIYVAEGALEGGLRILQLASARGHFENHVIVFAIWILLKQFPDRTDAADAQMNFLTSAFLQSHLTQEDVDIGGMKLEYIMMHCANHLRMKFLSTTREKLRKTAYEIFRAVLTELYIAATKVNPQSMKEMLDWFDESSVWMEAGRCLETTPFGILLSEECYWQAFRRKPLDPHSLDLILSSMQKYNRGMSTRSFLERALKISPWHINCRAALCAIDVEEDVPYMLSWLRVFDGQELKICKIQAWYRGIMVRIWWRTGKVDIILRKQQALKKLNRSGKAFLVQRDRHKQQLFKQWKETIIRWKAVKQRSSITIQVFWRRVWAEYCYAWAKYRVRRANCLYLVVTQHHANTKSMRVFRAWQEGAGASKLKRSANTIVEQLRADKNYQVFHKYVTLLVALKRVRRKIHNSSSFRMWRKIFRGRQRKHAMVSIRFYVRNNYMTRGLPKKETKAQLEERMQVMEALVSKTITLNPLNKIRPCWTHWRLVLHRIRAIRARLKVAKLLPLLWHRRLAREKVRGLRLRTEAVAAGFARLEKVQLRKVYRFIRMFAVTLRIQRFMRCSLSRIHLRKLRARHVQVNEKFGLKCDTLLRRMIWRWNKGLFLQRREKVRARYKILRGFSLVKCKRVLAQCNIKKFFISSLLYLLHRRHLKKQFRTLKMNTIIQFQIDTLIPFCSALARFHVRHNMRKWKELILDQDKLKAIVKTCILSPLDRQFWKDAHESTAERSVVTQRPNWRTSARNGPNSGSLVLPTFLEWEKVVRPSTRLWSNKQLPKLLVFKKWMAAYRQKCRDRRGGSRVLVATVVPFIMSEVWHRINCRVRLQCFVRSRLAVKKACQRTRTRRIAEERFRAKHISSVKALLHALHVSANDCRAARLVLQCSWRVFLARRLVSLLRISARNCRNAFSKLDTSLYRKALIRSVMGRWTAAFAGSKCYRLLTSLDTLGPVLAAPDGMHSDGTSAAKPPQNAVLNGSIGPDHPMLFVKSASSDVGTEYKAFVGSLQSRTMMLPAPPDRVQEAPPLSHSIQLDEAVAGKNKSKRRHITEESKRLSNLRMKRESQNKFQSQLFNAKMFQLRQTGVFVLNKAELDNNRIYYDEASFFVTNCETLFVQNIHLQLIEQFVPSFRGGKIILCGGQLDYKSGMQLLKVLAQRTNVSIHFSSIKLNSVILYHLVGLVSSVRTHLRICELFLDSDSMERLAFGVFCGLMKVLCRISCCCLLLCLNLAILAGLSTY
jgi:hypothetical protein